LASKYKKRSDGRYPVQVQTGYHINGKPKYKNLYARTHAELEKKERAFKSMLEKGIVLDDVGLDIAEWSLKWLESYKTNKSYNTFRMYESAILTHIIPNLGHIRLKDLKSFHVQELINKLSNDGLTRTLEIIKLTLTQILDQAAKNDYIYKNVAKDIELPTIIKPVKRSLSKTEISYLYSGDYSLKVKAFVFTLLLTGIRRGEALALTKNDIDLKNRRILINKSGIIKSNQAEIKNTPKSSAGIRKISIVDELYDILSEYIPTVQNIYVFPSANNKLMSSSAFRRFWDMFLNAFNLASGGTNGKFKVSAISNDVTPHIFRHTYATTLYYAGIDIKTAQYLLGHSSIQMTMDIYTHLDAENNNTVLDKLNNYMSPKVDNLHNYTQ